MNIFCDREDFPYCGADDILAPQSKARNWPPGGLRLAIHLRILTFSISRLQSPCDCDLGPNRRKNGQTHTTQRTPRVRLLEPVRVGVVRLLPHLPPLVDVAVEWYIKECGGVHFAPNSVWVSVP